MKQENDNKILTMSQSTHTGLHVIQIWHPAPLMLCSNFYASTCFLLHVYWFLLCLFFPHLPFFSFLLFYQFFTLFTFTKCPPSTVPKTLHFQTPTPSQRLSELLNWPVSEVELERALFTSATELPAQTTKRELKIIEFMRKKDLRSQIFSRTRR